MKKLLFVLIFMVGCAESNLVPRVIPPPTVTLKVNNYCVEDGFTFKEVFAYNSSAKIVINNWKTDFDRDGLPDAIEKNPNNVSQFGISFKQAASFNPDFSDLITFRMGLDVTAQNLLPNCATGNIDDDQDGLNNCVENYIQTDSQKADTDGDGIPDGIEFRFDLNPIDANDAFQSMMGDELTNHQKIKTNIPVNLKAEPHVTRLALSYLVGPQQDAPNCFDMEISNIPVVDVNNGNKIMVYTLEDKITSTSGTTVLDREARWLSVVLPKETKDKSIITINDGINQQTVGPQ